MSDRYDHGAAIVDGGLSDALTGSWIDVSREQEHEDTTGPQQQEQADRAAYGAAQYR